MTKWRDQENHDNFLFRLLNNPMAFHLEVRHRDLGGLLASHRLERELPDGLLVAMEEDLVMCKHSIHVD
jgi:hypothetical protein